MIRLDPVPLRVLLELRNPLSYLAIAPTRALASDLGIDVDWLPVTTPPLKAPSRPGPDDDRGVTHRRWRAQAIARGIETYAAAQGLVVRDWYRSPDPDPAQRAWLWLREHDPKRLPGFLDALFRDYWDGSLDPSRPEAVEEVVRATGAEADAFCDWSRGEGEIAPRELREACERNGWSQSPLLIVEDELFVGRQHLPMIRWILEGRTGTVPI